MRSQKTYYNLSQTADPQKRLVYFRSTDVEQHNYGRLLWSVPDEILFLLVSGYDVEIIDISSNGRGKIERIFIPVFNDLLRSVWHKLPIKNRALVPHYFHAMNALFEHKGLRTKYVSWKKHAGHDCGVVIGKTIRVNREPNPLAKRSDNINAKRTIIEVDIKSVLHLEEKVEKLIKHHVSPAEPMTRDYPGSPATCEYWIDGEVVIEVDTAGYLLGDYAYNIEEDILKIKALHPKTKEYIDVATTRGTAFRCERRKSIIIPYTVETVEPTGEFSRDYDD